MANFRIKILVLVTCQIALIGASFLVIVYFESQTYHAGNVVNVAGKNRLLTNQVQTELDYVMFHADRGIDPERVFRALNNLEENILFLRDGGTFLGIKIESILPTFADEWQQIHEKFEYYKSYVYVITYVPNNVEFDSKVMGTLREVGDEIILRSDALTSKLGHDAEKHSTDLVFLQLILGTVNITSHIVMIYLILYIFKRHADESVKTERFAAMGEIAAMVAHDIKNPLGTILNCTYIIRNPKTDKKTLDKATDMISRSTMRISHQVDGVLHYARDVPLFLAERSVREMLQRALESLQIPENLNVHLPDNDTVMVCDVHKMEFVFANLLLNAVQAIDGKDGSVTVRLDATSETDFINLDFENTGPPIPEKDISQIFEPLYTTKMQGTGLGLTSCKKVVLRHGGRITVRNNPVTFSIDMPRKSGR